MANKDFNIGSNLDESNKIELTAQGKKDLEAQLYNLINVERPRIQTELAEARAQGDLSENAEYDAAKDKQAEIESKISKIEDTLTRAKIVRAAANKDEVHLGTTVTYRKGTKEETVMIVPEAEFDPLAEIPKVGANAPFAQAVMGARVGDDINIRGPKEYKITIVKLS